MVTEDSKDIYLNKALNFSIFKNPQIKVYEFPPSELAINLSKEYLYQPYMIERYLQMFGKDETIQLLKANDQISPVTIRVNTLKTDPETLIKNLQSKGYNFEPFKEIPFGFNLNLDINQEITKERLRAKERSLERPLKKKESNETEVLKQDFSRDPKLLETLDWGKPEFKPSAQSNEQQTQEKNDSDESFKDDALKSTKIGKKIYKKQIATLGSTHEYLMGYYYIQSYASMLPALYLNPKEEDIVVDMCAAPGGKTTQMAQLMNNKGKIIAIESSSSRIKALIYNLRRCGVKNTTVLNIDSTKINELDLHPKKILLDAPCSGEGIIRDDPTRKKSKTPDHIKRYMAIQMELLISAAKSVVPGGYVMYSTCSIAPEENEFIIENLLETYNKMEIAPINDNWGFPGFTNIFNIKLSDNLVKARRYYPHIHNTDGFFLCLLRKKV